MSKAIDALRERGIYNPHNYAASAGGKGAVYIAYRSYTSRPYRSAAWQIIGVGHRTDTSPTAWWGDYGHKTFNVYGRVREDKEPMRLLAIEWASEKYGITEWARSPFGTWHPADHVKKMQQLIKNPR